MVHNGAASILLSFEVHPAFQLKRLSPVIGCNMQTWSEGAAAGMLWVLAVRPYDRTHILVNTAS